MSSSGSNDESEYADAESSERSESEWADVVSGDDEDDDSKNGATTTRSLREKNSTTTTTKTAGGGGEGRGGRGSEKKVIEEQSRSRVRRPPRRRAPRSLEKLEDFRRFDRPDMFADDVFPFFGIHLMPDRDGSKSNTVPGYKLPPHCKVLRLSVDGGVPAGPRELFERIQVEALKKREVPEELRIDGETFELSYVCPEGDEMSFGSHSQDAQLIGDRFLGSVLVSRAQKEVPAEGNLKTRTEQGIADMPAWDGQLTFKTWHKHSPFGAGCNPPPPVVLPHRTPRPRTSKA